MTRLLGLLAAGLITAITLLVIWPAVINPASWQPAADPGATEAFALNDSLLSAQIITLASGHGPEDIAVDRQGRLYAGLQDGRIVRVHKDGRQETFASIAGGRPLGLHFDPYDNLVVADAYKGLLSIDSSGQINVLSHTEGGKTFTLTDDLDIAADGKIYFSDASDTYDLANYQLDVMEARGHGRLLVYDPATKTTTKLMDGLYFANGVAVSSAGDFVLVNETGRYRVTRYWLTGDKAGSHDIFINNLPGFPDGISRNRDGRFWLALVSPRNPLLDQIHPTPWLKSIIAKLPSILQPDAVQRGTVIELDEQGNVHRTLHDSNGQVVSMITSVEQVDNTLYLGTLDAPRIVTFSISTL